MTTEKASAIARRKILEEIEHEAEMECYFHAKVNRTPIELCHEDMKIELHYTESLLEKTELAKRMGIPDEEIENARDAGIEKAWEAVEEADCIGWE